MWLLLRTGWASLLVVPAVLVVLVAAVAVQMVNRYPTPASREVYAAAYAGVSGISAFQGRGYELTDLGGMLANEMGFLSLVLFPVAGLLLAIRHTRAVEDTGHLDILTAGRTGRLAPLTAGATVVAISATLMATGASAVLLGLGYPARGSLLYPAALALLLLTFAAIGLVAAQLAQTAPQAYGLALAVFLLTYLLRAVIDVRHASATWSSPGSWLAETRPFADRLISWPWVAYLLVIVAFTGLALRISQRRDLGAGVLTPRPGPARAPHWTASPAGLILRLTRGSALAWLIGSGIFAFAFGSLGNDMQILMSRTRPENAGVALDTLVALYAQINALFAGAVAVQTVTAWSREERLGRLGWILSTAVGRRQAWLSATAITGGWSLLTLASTGLLIGLGLALGLREGSAFTDGLTATLAYAPAVLFVAAAALLLAAAVPAATAASWTLVGWGLVVTFLGDPLDLGQGLRNLSPFEWSGQVPLDPWRQAQAVTTTVCAGIGVLLSVALFRRRGLMKG
ncbi:hypothetical protein [Cryptosporangium sp. NPDC048952]|uniref:hypothetical protein n=1 Tax=Cryptosporangium sp. NPDC048952 TaxID=3363961 RepID=UPI00372172EF